MELHQGQDRYLACRITPLETGATLAYTVWDVLRECVIMRQIMDERLARRLARDMSDWHFRTEGRCPSAPGSDDDDGMVLTREAPTRPEDCR